MRLIPLAALAIAAACSGDRAPKSDAAPAAPVGSHAPAQAERSVLSLERGGSTILTERVTRTADRMESEMTAGASEGRMTYAATLNPDATVSRLEGQLFAAGAAAQSAPAGRLSVVFQGDSAMLELTQGDSTQRARIGVPRGTIPIPVSEAVATLEQILRRARALGGTQATVPILTIEKGVETGRAEVTFTGDSARVVIHGDDSSNEVMVATDSAGRLLGGRVPASGVVIRRTQ